MFDEDSSIPPAKVVDGAFFLDSNPDGFSVILDYLREDVIKITSFSDDQRSASKAAIGLEFRFF